MNNDLHDKIRKLLAMAESAGGNEHEMKNAMKMASDLMMRHGIEREQLGEATPKAGFGSKFHVDYIWYQDLAIAAAVLCGCKTVHWYKHGIVQFVGRPENIDGAQDIYGFLVLQLEMFYKASLPKGMTQKQRGNYRKTFKIACALRIRDRAEDIVKSQPKETGTALMVIDHRNMLLAEAEAARGKLKDGPKLRRPPGLGTEQGHKAGDKVDLNRKVQPESRRIAS